MKQIRTIISTLSLSILAASAYASNASSVRYEEAEVIDVTPLTRMVHVPEQQEECWHETVSRPAPRDSSTPTIVGGIVGGVVGNQFGRGHGRTAATVAGSLLGGAVANDIARDNGPSQSESVRRCRVIDVGYSEERIEGYQVTYQYDGVTYKTRTATDPGEQIKVRVRTSVSPVISRLTR